MWHVWETGEVYIRFWWRGLWERGRLENLGVDGRIILKRSSSSVMRGKAVDLARDWNRLRALLNAVMNLRVQ